VVVATVADELRVLAIELHIAGMTPLAKTLMRQSRRLAAPGDAVGCKGCGQPVPDVPNGRPRAYCHACRKPRTKVRTKAPEPANVNP
jgi:hypothetical protein